MNAMQLRIHSCVVRLTAGLIALAAQPWTALLLAFPASLIAQCAPVWNPQGGPGTGFNNLVLAVAESANGELIVAGGFSTAGGVPASVAKWNGTQWTPLGNTFSAPYGYFAQVNALAVLDDGQVVAGGWFEEFTGSSYAVNIARWNGTGWQPLGNGLPWVLAILPMPGGQFMAGSTDVSLWDGASWQVLGSSNGMVSALARLPSGDIVAGGNFTSMSGVGASRIARWNGTSWQGLGSGLNGEVFALTVLPNGDLIAGGEFGMASGVSASRIARWDGSNWSPLGGGFGSLSGSSSTSVRALLTLPDGDVLAGGTFTTAGSTPIFFLARWNGAVWSSVGGGINHIVEGLVARRNGTIAAVGSFSHAGGAPADGVAELLATCPPGVTLDGSGCSGSGGLATLAAGSLPWLGNTFVAHATGLPTSGFGITAFGTAAINQPLATILPQAQPACALLLQPFMLEAQVVTTGAVAASLTIPDIAALVGYQIRLQSFGLGTAASGSIIEAVSTNALTITLGTL